MCDGCKYLKLVNSITVRLQVIWEFYICVKILPGSIQILKEMENEGEREAE